MNLRLILFIIAVLVIAWIIWDHNRKNSNKNRYTKRKHVSTRPLEELEYDIEQEIYSPYSKDESKLNLNGQRQLASAQRQEFENDFFEEDAFEQKKSFTKKPADFEFIDEEEDDYYEDSSYGQQVHQNTNHQPNKLDHNVKKVFTLYIQAKGDEEFRGDSLLQALLSVGCRFGAMDIFHRHEKTSGHGKVLFSVASIINPGTFDIDNIQDITTPGLALFFTCPGTTAPLMVFDLMLKTSYKLAKFLHAEILDDQFNRLTSERVAEIRTKINKMEASEYLS